MDPWYDLHSSSKQYRQEALREARGGDLVEQPTTSRSPRPGRARANRALPLLRAAHLTQ